MNHPTNSSYEIASEEATKLRQRKFHFARSDAPQNCSSVVKSDKASYFESKYFLLAAAASEKNSLFTLV